MKLSETPVVALLSAVNGYLQRVRTPGLEGLLKAYLDKFPVIFQVCLPQQS
jgi:hypothetical protein